MICNRKVSQLGIFFSISMHTSTILHVDTNFSGSRNRIYSYTRASRHEAIPLVRPCLPLLFFLSPKRLHLIFFHFIYHSCLFSFPFTWQRLFFLVYLFFFILIIFQSFCHCSTFMNIHKHTC